MRALSRLLTTLAILSIGCAPGYRIHRTVDAFDGHEIVRSEGNRLPSSHFEPSLSFEAMRHMTKAGEARYSVAARFEGVTWMFIEPGESLVLLIDGERLGLRGEGSLNARTVLAGVAPSIIETAVYRISFDDLLRIGRASDVQLRLRGSSLTQERRLSSANIQNLYRFAMEYPPPEHADVSR